MTEAVQTVTLRVDIANLVEIEALRHVLMELEHATGKFPTWPTDPLHAVGVLNEEVGELNKAILQAVYEPQKSSPADVREEAIQAAAMALRFVMSLETYQYRPGEQHQQQSNSTMTTTARSAR